VLIKSLVLISLDYSKNFQLFFFASNDTIASVLLQKNDQGEEQPIAFMSKFFRDVELKYAIMEKQAYALVKSLKHFTTYIGISKVIAYVPHLVVKDILSQQDCLGTRGKWVDNIQEYDLDINPTQLIKGKGLSQMMVEGNEVSLGLKDESCPMNSTMSEKLEHHGWYIYIIYYLKNLTSPRHLLNHKKRDLSLRASNYCLNNQGLGWRNLDGLILICVDTKEENNLMDEFHKILCGGHHAINTTTHILRGG
jgi:hypothetical protein